VNIDVFDGRLDPRSIKEYEPNSLFVAMLTDWQLVQLKIKLIKESFCCYSLLSDVRES
jgi:hypothetical protein